MQVSEAVRIADLPQMSVRLMTITGFLCALCFTGSPLHGDDTAKKSQDRAASFEDLLGKIVEKNTATLLSSLRVEKAIEKSLWKTVLSPATLTRGTVAIGWGPQAPQGHTFGPIDRFQRE